MRDKVNCVDDYWVGRAIDRMLELVELATDGEIKFDTDLLYAHDDNDVISKRYIIIKAERNGKTYAKKIEAVVADDRYSKKYKKKNDVMLGIMLANEFVQEMDESKFIDLY